MKIAIIGRGTSAIIQALRLLHCQYEIDIYYDPEIPILAVGESSTPSFGRLIYDVLGVSIGNLVDEKIASHKLGVEFINWGKGTPFRHYFHNGGVALHFQTKILNSYLEKKLEERGVKYIPKRVENHTVKNGYAYIDNVPYNFVIYCTGWSKEEFKPPLLETVNSAILYKKKHLQKEPAYTLHEATEHGWQFGIPFPDLDETRHGYLYNNKINSKDEIIDKLRKERGVSEYKTIEWVPKQSTILIKDTFHAYNGNRLMFNEPLQAMSLAIYDGAAELIEKFLITRDSLSITNLNKEYLKIIRSYYETLAFHYRFGSSIDSPFWRLKRQEADNFLSSIWEYDFDKLFSYYHHDVNMGVQNGFYEMVGGSEKLVQLGPFIYIDFKDLYQGMTQTKIP